MQHSHSLAITHARQLLATLDDALSLDLFLGGLLILACPCGVCPGPGVACVAGQNALRVRQPRDGP
eukprot:2077148-Amphidinium_carterae.1